MEGDGESVIAVVRGSTSALTVTLVAETRRESTRKYIDSSRNLTRISHSSAETNTDRNWGNYRVPIYDVRYASSFGFTDYQSSDLISSPQTISSMFRGTDIFTQSLRKYPIDRSSAEFIQRIIDYSRTKKYAKKRYPRCLRTVLRKAISQTKATNTCENPYSVKDEVVGHQNHKKDLSKNELLNYTYDYLKSSSQTPRDTDVRFLTDMKRAVRGQLRCMADDEPGVCPRIRSRYNHHRRYYHDNKDLDNNKVSEKENGKMNPKTVSIGVPNSQPNAGSNIASCQTDCKPCQSPCDWHDQKSEELFHKSQDTETQVLVNEINSWMNTIPVYETFSEADRIHREELTDELAKKLQNLQKNVNFPTLAKEEVKKYLNVLPMWRSGDSEYEGILVEQIADDLISRLTNLAEVNFKTAISAEVKKLPFDENLINDDDINKTIDTFVTKLKAVALNRPTDDKEYKDMLKSEVANIIKDLPLRSDHQDPEQQQRLVEKIVDQIQHNKIFKVDSKQAIAGRVKKTLLDWCTEIPELSNYNTTQYSDLLEVLADKLRPYDVCNVKDDNCTRELQGELSKWLDDIALRLGTKFIPERKLKLINELMEKLFGGSIIERVIKWFKNIPELSMGDSIETNRALKNLAFQLKEVLNNNDDIETIRGDMKDIITKWLNHMLKSKNIELDSRTRDNMLNDLILMLTDVSAQKKELLHRDVVTWFEELPYMKLHDNLETNNLVRDFVVRLVEIQATNDEVDIEEEIEKFVEQLSAANDSNITSDYIDKLKSTVLTRFKCNVQDSLSKDISNILESCSMLTNEQKNNLKKKIKKEIFKNISDSSINWDNVLSELENIVKQETQLNTTEIEELVNKIAERADYILLNDTMKKRCNRSDKTCKICKYSEMQKNSKRYLEERLLNNNNIQNESQFYNNSNEISVNSTRKYTVMDDSQSGNQAMLRNIDLASQNLDKKIERRKSVDSNHTNAMNNMNNFNQTLLTIDKVTEESFLDKNFSTSTPISTTIRYPSIISSRPSATFNNNTISNGNFISFTETPLEHSHCLSKLKNIIRNWVNKFDILNLNEINIFVDNIASDIINRQNVLKLSNKKTTEKDELEYLKYQIFKRLHNIVDHKILPDIISNVSCLNRIIFLKLPEFEQLLSINKLDETRNSQMQSINAYVIVQKLTNWYTKMFPESTLNNSKHNRDKIQELGRNLELLKINGNYDREHIKKEIIQWLPSIINNIDFKQISELTENLTAYLNDTIVPETFILQQDTSEFISENLSGAIADWFRTTQYRNKLQNQIQSYFASLLANDIKQVLANCLCLSCDEVNKLLIEEIVKNLGKFTGNNKNSRLCYENACDLLKYLKDLKLFHGITEKKDTNTKCNKICEDEGLTYEYEIKEAIIEWLKSLPLEEGKTFRDILDIVQNFFEVIVKHTELNILNNENLLREKIIRFLSKIPLKINDDGYSGIENLAAALTTIIKDIYIQKKLMKGQESLDVIYNQLLHDTISKTFLEKCTTAERLSFNLVKEKLAFAFIDLHYVLDDEGMRIEFKNKLCKEISRFCNNYGKSCSVAPPCGNKLKENLHTFLINVSLPIIKSLLEIDPDKIIEEIFKCIEGVPVCSAMVSILANRIYPILNRSELNNDNIHALKHEVMNWLQSLSLQSSVLCKDRIANGLIENFKMLVKCKKALPKQNTHLLKSDAQYTNQASNLLRTDEIDHLKSIRARSDLQKCKKAILKSADIGIQTVNKNNTARGVETNTTYQSSIHKEISPQVIVKEYAWDSIGSNQMASPKTIVTSESQTDTRSRFELKSQRPLITKERNLFEVRSKEISRTTDTQTQITDDFQQKRRPVLKSQHCQAPYIPSSENLKCWQTQCRNKENVGQSCRQKLESETINHLEPFDEYLSNEPRTMFEKLSPVVITEKTSERRCYVSPGSIDIRKRKGNDICCSCRNHLLTKCRSKPYNGCRQRAPTNLKHCSKCFGGNCPHPSYFFFKRDL